MNNKNNNNDVYFLGNKRQKTLRKYIITASFTIVCMSIILYFCTTKSDVSYKQELPTVEALPQKAISPKFDGKYEFSKFLEWVSKNLTYPAGYETKKAKVVVSFVITNEGTIDNIKIISEPEQKAFAKEVVLLLKKCPKWTPGKLADGTPVSISYILPVNFNNIKRFD